MNNTKPKAATPISEESHDGRGCCESKHATSPNESRMGGASVGHLSCKPCFLFADVTLFHLCLRLRCSAKLGNPAAIPSMSSSCCNPVHAWRCSRNKRISKSATETKRPRD